VLPLRVSRGDSQLAMMEHDHDESAGTSRSTFHGTLRVEDLIPLLSEFMRNQPREEASQEQKSSRALQNLVKRHQRFDGRNITTFLRHYVCEMELNRVCNTEMIRSFELAVVPELRNQIRRLSTAITWIAFEQALKNEFFDDDADRVTKRTFLDWVEEKSGSETNLHSLLREFEAKFFLLSPTERTTLEVRKVELFLEMIERDLADRLSILIADKTTDGGVTDNWSEIEDAVTIITKQQRSRGKLASIRAEAKIPITTSKTSHAAEARKTPLPSDPMDELVRGMRDLKVVVAGLQKQSLAITSASLPPPTSYNKPTPTYVRRCIFCDDISHTRNECTELAEYMSKGIVHMVDGKIHLTSTGTMLRANFGKGGIKTMIPSSSTATTSATHVIGSYGDTYFMQVDHPQVSIVQIEDCAEVELKRGAEMIRQRTGWEDPVAAGCIQAYLQEVRHVHSHDAFVEAKRGRDELSGADTEDSSRPIRTRKKVSFVPEMETETIPIPIDLAKPKEKESELKVKSKTPNYKLQSDIESTTNLKEILEERILDSKIEFSLREVLGIAKRDFHELIIDVIKRKRQMTVDVVMTKALDTKLSKEEDEELAQVFAHQIDPPQQIAKVSMATEHICNDCREEEEATSKRFAIKHWARACPETEIYLGEMSSPVLALVDSGSEINIISSKIYEKEQWPIDTGHGWAIRTANNQKGELYGACPRVKTRIGDIALEQNFFVHKHLPYPVILGQPFITASRMQTIVMDDGSQFARIRSVDGTKSVQFFVVKSRHGRNRLYLRKETDAEDEGEEDFH